MKKYLINLLASVVIVALGLIIYSSVSKSKLQKSQKLDCGVKNNVDKSQTISVEDLARALNVSYWNFPTSSNDHMAIFLYKGKKKLLVLDFGFGRNHPANDPAKLLVQKLASGHLNFHLIAKESSIINSLNMSNYGIDKNMMSAYMSSGQAIGYGDYFVKFKKRNENGSAEVFSSDNQILSDDEYGLTIKPVTND